MSQATSLLLLLFTIAMIIGLVYTYRVAENQRKRERYDTAIGEKVQENPITRNPVFLTYLVGLGIAFLYLVYVIVIS